MWGRQHRYELPDVLDRPLFIEDASAPDKWKATHWIAGGRPFPSFRTLIFHFNQLLATFVTPLQYTQSGSLNFFPNFAAGTDGRLVHWDAAGGISAYDATTDRVSVLIPALTLVTSSNYFNVSYRRLQLILSSSPSSPEQRAPVPFHRSHSNHSIHVDS